jgi:hypothetical protein
MNEQDEITLAEFRDLIVGRKCAVHTAARTAPCLHVSRAEALRCVRHQLLTWECAPDTHRQPMVSVSSTTAYLCSEHGISLCGFRSFRIVRERKTGCAN